MNLLLNLSIRNKLILVILTVSFLVTGLGFSIMTLHQYEHLTRDLNESSILQAQVISEYCISPLLFDDFDGVDDILEKINVNPLIQTVAVYDENGTKVGSFIRDNLSFVCPSLLQSDLLIHEKNSLHIHQPIKYKDIVIGTIGLHVSTERVKSEMKQYIITIILFLIGLMILAYFLADVLQRHISNPILELASISDQITKSQNYNVNISRDAKDEIGTLFLSFKRMINQINVQQSELEEALEREKRGLFYQKVLYRAAVQLGNLTNMSEIYDYIYKSIYDVMDVSVFIVSSFDSETNLITASFMKLENNTVNVDGLPPVPLEKENEGTQSRVIHSGKPFYANNLTEEIKKAENCFLINKNGDVINNTSVEDDTANPVKSAIYVPLKYEQQVVGVMQVQSCQIDAYTHEDVELLYSLANVISIALQNSKLLNEMELKIASRTSELNEQVQEKEQLNRAMMNVLEDQEASNITLAKTSKLLEDSNKELEAFAYSISHDLRAPLRAIVGFAQMLAEDHGELLNEDGNRQIDVIQNSARDMGLLIDGLLRFSRLGRKGLHFSKIDMNNLAYEVLKILLGENPNQSYVDLKMMDIPEAFGDVVLIKEVFQNLIANAIKFSSLRDKPEIEIGYKDKESETIYFVSDNGAGFDMKYADKLFGVFQRLHDRDTYEGTGIGLALVQRIIHMHGGRIWAEAEVDKGATFYFIVPDNLGVRND